MSSELKNNQVSCTLPAIWVITFCFVAITSLFVQLMILPFWLPDLHAGNGLLVGGDWVGFSRIASDLAEAMVREGWGAWELRPERQSPSGIAAIFYYFFGAHPWSLVPLNAAVHATTALILIRILQIFNSDVCIAVICVLPFILFPTSLIWYSQIHKDGIFFLGIMFNLYGWLLFASLKAGGDFGLKAILAALYIFIGCFLVWIMRPYGIKMMQGIGCIFVIILVPYFIAQCLRQRLLFRQAFLACLIIISLPMLIDVFNVKDHRGEVQIVTKEMMDLDQERLFPGGENEKGISIAPDTSENYSFVIKAQNTAKSLEWKNTDWLPRSLDNLFLTLAIIRSGYSASKGESNIDDNIQFSAMQDFFQYLPRAIQIGFTAPFPSFWYGQDYGGNRAVFKTINGIEMLLVYFSLLFLAYAVFNWHKKIETWLILVFCTSFILLYTFITPNIGSLIRTRHGFLMLLVAFSIAGGITFWRSKLGKMPPSANKSGL